MAIVNGTGNGETINAAFGTTALNDTIFAFGGDDFVVASGGNDLIDGGLGFDILDYGAITDRIVINAAFGSMRQINASTVVKSDTFTNIEEWRTGSGDDVLVGAGIDEQFRPSLGRDFVNGGAGFDGILYTDAATRVFVDLVRGFALDHGGFRDTLVSIEYARGGSANDVIRGNGESGLLRGGNGNDSFVSAWDGVAPNNGGIGVDYNERNAASPVTVDLAAGFAQIGAERDTLIGNFTHARGGTGADTLLGNGFNNVFRPRNGADTMDGRGGFDRADYRDEGGAITANMTTANSGTVLGSDGTTDTLTSIEWVRGSNSSDTLQSVGAAFTMFGAYGFAAGDTPHLEGWAGGDTLTGQAGRAVIARYAADPGPVFADLAAGFAIDGWGGVDTLTNIWGILGSAFGDTITLGAGNDWVRSDDGDDVLDGGAGLDRVSYDDAPAAVIVDLAAGTAQDGWGNTDTLTGFEVVTGTDFNDQLFGDANNNWFIGGDGNDLMDGRGGNDTAVYFFGSQAGAVINLGPVGNGTAFDSSGGIDTLVSIENVIGTRFADFVIGSSLDNALYGYLGDDTLTGAGGQDLLDGGEGSDTADYSGTVGRVVINLNIAIAQNTISAGSDTLVSIENVTGSQLGDDTLTGNGLANTLRGVDGNDTIFGGDGDDTVEGGEGNDILQGNGGTDTAEYALAGGAVTVSLALQGGFQATGGAGSDFLNGFENLTGSFAFADVLTGNTSANVLRGLGGNDTIDGGGGDDIIDGGPGALGGLPDNDVLTGGSGIDTVTYESAQAAVVVSLLAQGAAQNTQGGGNDFLGGFENVTGSAFNDTLTGDATNNVLKGGFGDDILQGGLGNDQLNGGDGIDLASYADAAGPVTVYLNPASATVAAGTDFFVDIEGFLGSAFADTLVGNTANNVLKGGAGNDRLYGLAGDDTFEGGLGNDQYFGDIGSDTVDFSAATVTARAVLGSGGFVDTINFGLDQFNGIENLTGGSAADFFTGDALANILDGRGGNDIIVAGAGDDTLLGGADNDTLTGGLGADRIHLGTGSDIIRYGAAAESQAASLDRIINFTQAGGDGFDRIGLENNAGALFGGVTPTSILLGTRVAIEAASELSDLVAQIAGLAASTASALSVTQVDVGFGGVAGRYLVVNDTVAGFNAATDMLIAIEMAPGSTANLTAANFFLF
jgi:Ca2+-binding RTX toxin-like protein